MKHGLYHTFIRLKLKHKNKNKNILIGSIYRPPSSKRKSSEIFRIIDEIKKREEREKGIRYEATIIGGDLNSENEEWGGRKEKKLQYRNKYKDGKNLAIKSTENGYRIINSYKIWISSWLIFFFNREDFLRASV